MFNLPPATHDVDAERFERLCRELAEHTHRFEADLVVGIATGGEHVAREMRRHMVAGTGLVAVRLQRPGTRVKARLRVDRLLRRTPRRVVDLLRWLEVEYREAAHAVLPYRLAAPEPAMGNATALQLLAPARDAERVLVVDDTVDSGETLDAVVALVRRVNPTAEVRTAVLTSTWRRPPVEPHYCLYRRTLLRLPWSMDVAVDAR